MIKLRYEIAPDGNKYAIIYLKFLFWEWTLYGIKVAPPEIGGLNIPLPKGIRFPKMIQPTAEESSLVQEMMETPGYKVLKRFWNREAIILAITCIAEKNRIQEKQGEYMGFIHAQIIMHKIVNQSMATGEVTEEEETSANVYEDFRRFDQQAASEFY